MKLDRTIPPGPSAPRPFTFPKFTTTTVLNGIPLYIIEDHLVPLASLQVVFRSGSSSEVFMKEDISGLANFTTEILLSGTETRSALEIANEIDFMGARLDTNCGRDEITISVHSLSKFLEKCIEVMADVTMNPSFPEDEVEREKKHAISTIIQNQADAMYLSSVQFKKEVFGNTPYGREITGTIDSLNSIMPENCAEFHKSFFTPDNAFFVASGNITEPEIRQLLEKYFANWSGTKTEIQKDFSFPQRAENNRVILVDRPNSVQSSLKIGMMTVSRNHPDYLALTVLNTIFGGYFGSRLNKNLREKNGYTYGVHSFLDFNQITGNFSIGTQVGANVTIAAIEECIKELEIINNELIQADELETVKNYLNGSQALRLETSDQIAGFVKNIAIYNLPENYYQELPDKIRAISSEHLNELAKQYFPPNGLNIVVCGDSKVIAEGLKKFGDVKIVNNLGNLI